MTKNAVIKIDHTKSGILNNVMKKNIHPESKNLGVQILDVKLLTLWWLHALSPVNIQSRWQT